MAKKLKDLIENEKPEVVSRASKKAKVILAKEPAPKKPTVKQLQEQVDNLGRQLKYANDQVTVAIGEIVAWKEHVGNLNADIASLQKSLLSQLDKVGELERRSLWDVIVEKFNKE